MRSLKDRRGVAAPGMAIESPPALSPETSRSRRQAGDPDGAIDDRRRRPDDPSGQIFPQGRYVIVAGVGGSVLFNASFETEADARLAFRTVRLQRVPAFGWAELLETAGAAGVFRLCWFGESGAADRPDRMADLGIAPPPPAPRSGLGASDGRPWPARRPSWSNRASRVLSARPRTAYRQFLTSLIPDQPHKRKASQ